MDMALKVASLSEMTLPELKKLWLNYYPEEPVAARREFYISRIAYRMQELVYGGVPKATKEMLLQMKPKEIIAKHRIPPVGSRIIKNYKDKEYTVRVMQDGFEFNGLKYKNLSAIALLITGQKLSGYSFFGLDKGL